jgi:hypothetical protein
MGKLLGGLYGATTGKVGNIVSYVLNGQNITRMNGKSNKESSIGQIGARTGFKIINEFLSPVKGYIDLGFMFEKIGTKHNQHNLATSYNMKNAIKGTYPELEIDYSKIRLSEGKLPFANNPIAIVKTANITINWEYNNSIDFNYRNDRLMALFFYPKTTQATFFLSGSERSAGTQLFAIQQDEINGKPEIYVSFFAEDRLSVSDSIWVNY